MLPQQPVDYDIMFFLEFCCTLVLIINPKY